MGGGEGSRGLGFHALGVKSGRASWKRHVIGLEGGQGREQLKGAGVGEWAVVQ